MTHNAALAAVPLPGPSEPPGPDDYPGTPHDAVSAREAAQAEAEAERAEQRASADRIIRNAAQDGRPFSANDLRSLMAAAGVPGSMCGAAFHRAISLGVIQPVTEVRSTDAGTHGKRILLYVAGHPKR
ncbi:MAG: hypothetical protein JWM93_4003 [Frankiales bacterium]|nr:hypothetical protein [Frankiales bacterium]